jgi:hypothetical protein
LQTNENGSFALLQKHSIVCVCQNSGNTQAMHPQTMQMNENGLSTLVVNAFHCLCLAKTMLGTHKAYIFKQCEQMRMVVYTVANAFIVCVWPLIQKQKAVSTITEEKKTNATNAKEQEWFVCTGCKCIPFFVFGQLSEIKIPKVTF